MLLSRCCDSPVTREWNLFMTREYLICVRCQHEIHYSDTVWVKTN